MEDGQMDRRTDGWADGRTDGCRLNKVQNAHDIQLYVIKFKYLYKQSIPCSTVF